MQLHPEIRSVVTLTHAHAHKVYMSGPLVRRIERLPDGHHPIKDEGWRDVWAQLGGTTLSIWDMKEIDEASKQGREVPPTYINVTDAVGLVLYRSRCDLTVCLVCECSRRRHDSRVRRDPRSEIQ
jgi:CCR4-NOT transcriptional complex subunit CAF120